jgi:CsoR family transcriptional regulator, copper-sensing transcriptional repressor
MDTTHEAPEPTRTQTALDDLHPVPGYSGDKTALLGRLRRVEGQVRGVQRMVDEDAYCIEVLTQISAATRALQAVAMGLLEDHLAHCVVDAARNGDPSAKVKEAADAIARLVRA